MATQFPPPSKRRRVEAEERTRTQQDEVPPPEGSVNVRFVDEQTGKEVSPTHQRAASQFTYLHTMLL